MADPRDLCRSEKCVGFEAKPLLLVEGKGDFIPQ